MSWPLPRCSSARASRSIAGPSAATDITTKFIDQKPSFIFRCSMIEKYQIDAILDWAVKNYKKIGLLHSTTGYGNFAAQEATAGLKARGVELVAVEAAAPGVNDLTPQMIKMRDAGADLILHFHESFELPYRPLPRLDYKPTFAGNWGLSSLKVKDIVAWRPSRAPPWARRSTCPIPRRRPSTSA